MPVDDHRPPQPPERWLTPPTPRRKMTGWQVAGIVLAVVLGICGLALVAGFVLVAVGMNMWASNK